MAECSYQNIKNPQPEPEDEEEEYTAVVGKHLSMLRLDNSSSSSSSFKSPNSSPKPRRTLKRRSPSQSPPTSQPNPKKEKLDLPPDPLLRRCSSERFNPTSPPPPPFYSFNSHHNQLQCPNAASPASASTDKASGAAALSSYASTLRRSVSNPKPSSCSPALKTFSRQSSSSSGDEDDNDDATPNSKRLRRIKYRVREMSLWFQQVMLENEDDDEEEEEELELEPPQEQHHQQNGDTTEVDSDINFAESVSVERMGDGLVIHFRCHCGVPYQFLLAGGNCYYKLM
ncbi:putative protein TPRXL [Prunus persica]|uniref:putative protein TPRXL n=1 Tax=Prunus persica TaxID=3760 RepID=UPI0009AB5E5F|nr:putative protein TPRXL [Prunus persica]